MGEHRQDWNAATGRGSNGASARPALTALLVLCAWTAHAGAGVSGTTGPAAPGGGVPGAGTILQDLKPLAPPAPAVGAPDLAIESPAAAGLPPSDPFPVKAIHISGNTAFAAATLQALVAPAEGRELTLAELHSWVSRITDFYHAHGYPLARAVIPAQTIRDGVVEVQVIEARYGKIRVENRSRVRDALLAATLEPVAGGQLIEQRELDHALLLLADVPGVTSSASLTPGEGAGTSDLVVRGAPGPFTAGTVTLDNDGNRVTGRARAGAEVALYDPLHHGDVLTANAQSSGKDLTYGRLSYDVLVGGAQTHLGAAYSALHYELGKPLVALDGHGTAQVESLWGRQTLLRTVSMNLYAQLQFDRKVLRDRLDVSAIRTDRHLGNWTTGLAGDWRDGLFSGGTGSWSLQWVRGRVDFDDAAARQADAATAGTQGAFSQWNASFGRLQRLSDFDGLFLTLSGQWADANLDPSQKLVAGGRYTVRAYDMSAASGDTGVQAGLEWRHDLAPGRFGQLQSVVFVETEHITVDKQVWTAGANDATLRGIGAGLNWRGGDQWSARAYVGARLGAPPLLIERSSRVRGWLELNKGF